MRPKWNLVVLDPASGRARPLAWVSVYLANTVSFAALYADDDVTPLTNPVQANALGQVAVRLNPGVYDVSMTWDGAVPVVVEDVVAYTPDNALVGDPGDIVIGGPDGGPVVLPAGADGEVLVMNGAAPDWQTLGGGDGLPPGPRGTLLVYDPADTVVVIPPGPAGTALVMAGGLPTWAVFVPSGTPLPINQPGDLLIGATAPPGEPVRLPVGASGRVLTSLGTQVSWEPLPAFLLNPMTALGDLIVGGVAGLPTRLGIGALDNVLRVGPTGAPIWGPSLGRGIGQCRLVIDGANLKLQEHQGNRIWVDQSVRGIPNGGVLLPPTGLGANTTYYIYAWGAIGSPLQLEASLTAYETTDGLTHKIGNPAFTLAGMARTIAGPAWVDTNRQRFVASWFNRRARAGRGTSTAERTTTSAAWVELHPEFRAEVLLWAGTLIQMSVSGSAYGLVTGTPPVTGNIGSALGWDGVVEPNRHLHVGVSDKNASMWLNIGDAFTREVNTEGYHYVTLMGSVMPAVSQAAWIMGTQIDVLIGN